MSSTLMGMKPAAIIFDFGGVLMDWDPFYLYRKILGDDRKKMDRFLQEVDFFKWNIENDRGRPFKIGIAELVARFPEHSHLIQAYNDRFLETLGGAIQPTVAILRTLKDTGFPIYGLSNWPAEKFALVRPHYPFFEWFDDIVISGEVGLVKPDKAIFELLLERIRRTPSECLFIDDHAPNINTAVEMGFQTIHFTSPGQLESELAGLGILNGKLLRTVENH